MSAPAIPFSPTWLLSPERRRPWPFLRLPRRRRQTRSIWSLVREHAIRHRAALFLGIGLNALPGIGVALQTLAPK